MSDQKPKRDPSALSGEYHKARKQLMLWAGILLIWELVGVDLEKAKEADGNFSALVKAIKSPQAVPWVLLILVAYFLFKVTVEWYQCNEARRNMKVARIDFASAWVVSLLACILYFAQAVSRVQFADVLQSSNNWQSLFVGISFGFIFAAAALIALEKRKKEFGKVGIISLVLLSLLGVPVLFGTTHLQRLDQKYLNWRFVLIGIMLVTGIQLIILWAFKPKIRAQGNA
jgi:hypothetical protein